MNATETCSAHLFSTQAGRLHNWRLDYGLRSQCKTDVSQVLLSAPCMTCADNWASCTVVPCPALPSAYVAMHPIAEVAMLDWLQAVENHVGCVVWCHRLGFNPGAWLHSLLQWVPCADVHLCAIFMYLLTLAQKAVGYMFPKMYVGTFTP